MDKTKGRRGALIALILGALGIGFAPVLVRYSEVGPSATAFYRLLFALPILWVVTWAGQRKSGKRQARPTGRNFLLLAAAGLLFTADLSLWHWSLQFTSVANSTLLANFAPLFVTIGAYLLLGEKITGMFVGGMVIAFAGAGLLVAGQFKLHAAGLRGDGLAVAAAAFYAGYLLAVKGLRDRLDAPVILAWSGVVSCFSLWIVALLSNETMVPRSGFGWWVVVALALVSHLGGQGLITYALGHLPASFSSVTLLLQPLFAALLAWVLLKESLTLWQWIGGIVILCGIFLAGRRPGSAQGGAS